VRQFEQRLMEANHDPGKSVTLCECMCVGCVCWR